MISANIENAKKNRADIIAFPELCICGYPPEDLLLKPAFINQNLCYLEKIKKLSEGIIIIVGFINQEQEIYNSAAVLYNNQIKSIYNKQFLPNYSVFDEERYFQKGNKNFIYKINDVPIGLNICEDIYYSEGPVKLQSILGGAELIINISASPYHIGKIEEREKILFTRAVDNRVNIMYVNLVGGQDELVFDGNSLIINEKGKILARAKPFKEDSLIFDLDTQEISATRLGDAKYKNQRIKIAENYKPLEVINLVKKDNYNTNIPENNSTIKKSRYVKQINSRREFFLHKEEEILEALILATKDYVLKNGFSKVIIGLSGGIDSALTAVIGTFAVGKNNVIGVIMPSMFTSRESIIDAKELSSNLGINTITIPISDIYNSYLENLKSIFKTEEINITKENIQARIRGNILMAISNENNWLVLSTGNKSEISVGYCTLYGDMAGGFSPIKDVYKTVVYDIAKFINKKHKNIIPENIISKTPSAELKPGQKDQDRLPPYHKLDKILKAYIEEEKDCYSIVKMGFKEKIVKDVINMVDFSEYKRRQGSPGAKITSRAFGKDRRYPITNNFKLT